MSFLVMRNLFNSDREKYFAVTTQDIQHYSKKIFDRNNSNTLYYL